MYANRNGRSDWSVLFRRQMYFRRRSSTGIDVEDNNRRRRPLGTGVESQILFLIVTVSEHITREIEVRKKEIRGEVVTNKNRAAEESGQRESSPSKRPRLSYQIVENRVDPVVDKVVRDVGLNQEQALGLRIFVAPLKAVVEMDVAPGSAERCMYLGGAGGTGKSQVIPCVKTVFRELGCSDLLVSATTGVAAQLIGGSTIDSLCKFSRRQKHDDDDRTDSQDVPNYWVTCRFLILDEASMLGCKKLSKISNALCKIKGNDLPFGGLHVLFCGDFQQLKPVQDTPLFVRPKSGSKKGKDDKNGDLVHGYELWSMVTETTIILRRNYRARDPVLSGLLHRLAKGQLTPADIDVLKSRVIGNDEHLQMRDWINAVVITPRNTVRQYWNGNAAVGHLIATGNQIFICPSRDEGVTCSRVNMLWTEDCKTDYLPTWNVLAIDAPALVTANMAVELQIANRTDVIIKEVVPHLKPLRAEYGRRKDDSTTKLNLI